MEETKGKGRRSEEGIGHKRGIVETQEVREREKAEDKRREERNAYSVDLRGEKKGKRMRNKTSLNQK